MRISQINTSILYEGVMLEIWIPGCVHKCPGCHNPELWNPNQGNDLTIKEITALIKKKTKWITGIVFTGGDPLYSANNLLLLIKNVKAEMPQLKIWVYTGYTKEEIDDDMVFKEIFDLCSVIITDRYDQSQKRSVLDQEHRLVGSLNQRIWRK